MLVAQDKTSKRTARTETINLEDPTKRLHVSMAEVRTHAGMAKAAPDGSTRINLCLNIDNEGGIVRDPRFQPMLDEIQKDLTRQ